MLLQRYIGQFHNALNLKVLSTLIRFVSSRNFEKGKIGDGKPLLNENVRKVWMYHLAPLNESLSDCHWARFLDWKITGLMNEYLIRNNLQNYHKIQNVNQIDLLKYQEDHFYAFHVDGGKSFERTLSCVLFLNNDYEGGELCFKNTFDDEMLAIKPNPGTVVIWPSNMLFPHAVKPVTKGTRYSIVSWAH